MRIILRFSLDGDGGKSTRFSGEIEKLLTGAGMTKTGTRTWEKSGEIDENTSTAVKDSIGRLSNIGDPNVGLDHLWLYIDKPNDKN